MIDSLDEPDAESAPHDPDADDRNAIDVCIARATSPSKGNWSAWATLAWIASGGNEKFVHAVQLYEAEQIPADGDDIVAVTAWWTLNDAAERWFGHTFAGALDRLEEAAQSNLPGGMAFSLEEERFVEVPPAEWNGWKQTFHERHGLTLVSGYHSFKWPSSAVRAAFPPRAPERAADGGKPAEPRRGSKPGPKKRRNELSAVMRPIFRRHHPHIVDMSRSQRHAYVLTHWSDGSIKKPSENTVEAHWRAHLERRAQEARAELQQ